MNNEANRPLINLGSIRAKKARLGNRIGAKFVSLLFVLSFLFLASGVVAIVVEHLAAGYFILTLALICFMVAAWTKWDLLSLPIAPGGYEGRLSIDILSKLKPDDNNPKAVWKKLKSHWQALFITNHLYIAPDSVESILDDKPESLKAALEKASAYADQAGNKQIELGILCAALLSTSPLFNQYLTQSKQSPKDVDSVADWLSRTIDATNLKRENFGGVGRDWAFGFTNFLNHFAANISLSIMHQGSNFGWLTSSDDVIAVESALTNNAGAVALIGPQGIGKTSRIYALAQRMIEGKSNKRLAYHQILKLDASTIISAAKGPGQLENIFNRLMSEAVDAGHVILFLDDAELFFNEGTGSINAGAILLPVLQARAIQFILTLTPEDYQRLRTNQSSLANLLTPVVINELPEEDVMNILEDSTIGMEHRFNCLITYEAIKQAYRLSGRYDYEEAYPGKAIKLLEQSISFATEKVVTATSVEAAIEQTRGVKVSSATQAEADTLLNLEDKIHERMINQNEAVKAVASALRRARAGIANPKRPIGSFLFLGPTGVGKTELAKAIAAVYFGSEANIIRLDMSEYQQESDISRLLDPGNAMSSSFLMSIRQQPFSVVLLDEVEKANPNILNLLLQLLDEGNLTDTAGRSASFKDAVVIATSNAGANEIRTRIASGGSLEEFKEQLTEQIIQSGTFKPELLNRFDEVVLFRPLNHEELGMVVRLLIKEVNVNLGNQNISVELSDAAIDKIVSVGTDERFGARPMRRALQRGVEDSVAQKILKGEAAPGSHLVLDAQDINL